MSTSTALRKEEAHDLDRVISSLFEKIEEVRNQGVDGRRTQTKRHLMTVMDRIRKCLKDDEATLEARITEYSTKKEAYEKKPDRWELKHVPPEASELAQKAKGACMSN